MGHSCGHNPDAAAVIAARQGKDAAMAMFHEGNRALQDRYGGRACADRIVELVGASALSDEYVAFVESVPFFFLATAAGDTVDCSFKGGAPGLVRALAPDLLAFPDYDGNRMYKSLGNIAVNPNVGLLFMKFGVEEGPGALYLRLRVSGVARVVDDHPEMGGWPGAQRVVEVRVREVFPNCPRYIPQMAMVAPSRHVPVADAPQPTPLWKTIPEIAEVL
jgi:predicted pyridoxine 5'-phosphate oxidase superfamily flavin-nucleotide-binding protein